MLLAILLSNLFLIYHNCNSTQSLTQSQGSQLNSIFIASHHESTLVSRGFVVKIRSQKFSSWWDGKLLAYLGPVLHIVMHLLPFLQEEIVIMFKGWNQTKTCILPIMNSLQLIFSYCCVVHYSVSYTIGSPHVNIFIVMSCLIDPL